MENLGNIELELRDLIQQSLRAIPEVDDVRIRPATGRGDRTDLELVVDGKQTTIEVKFRDTINAATAHDLARRYEDERRRLLVAARRITPDAAEQLMQRGISTFDGRGTIHLVAPGLVLHVVGTATGRRAAGARTPSLQRLTGKAARCAQALLVDAGRDWHATYLAARSGVSVALAHRVLVRLDEERITRSDGHGPNRTRRVEHPAALLDLWREEYKDRSHVTRTYVLGRTTTEIMERVADAIDARTEYGFTGACAARYLAPYVTDVPIVDLWLPAHVDAGALLARLDATTVDHGHNVTIRQSSDDAALAFVELDHPLPTVSRYHVYVDLARDPRRGREQAAHLRQELLPT